MAARSRSHSGGWTPVQWISRMGKQGDSTGNCRVRDAPAAAGGVKTSGRSAALARWASFFLILAALDFHALVQELRPRGLTISASAPQERGNQTYAERQVTAQAPCGY
jgi:hypothetical protein